METKKPAEKRTPELKIVPPVEESKCMKNFKSEVQRFKDLVEREVRKSAVASA